MVALLSALLLCASPARADALDAELSGIVDLFYGFDFDGAKKAADGVAERHPGHPAGPFYQSLVAYQRFLGTEDARAASLKEFEARNKEAVAAAEAWRSTDAATAEYYLGAARGFRGRVYAAQRKYFRALPEALKGVRHLKKAVKLDPGLVDAHLGLGMYHYFRARMPAAAKPFAFLLTGEGADAAKGLAELTLVTEKGGPAKMEARSVLAAIYASDKEAKWKDAEALLAELMARYPRNPLYRLRRVYVALKRGAYEQALALADPDGRWLDGLDPAVRRTAAETARRRSDEAKKALEDARAGRQPAPIQPWSGLETPR